VCPAGIIIMARREYSNYQKKVISRYYENRDQIDEQRLSELVTSLYLATGEKQKAKLWKSAEELMTRLEVPGNRVEHVVSSQDPAILAAVVQDLASGAIPRSKPGTKKP
jgi:hypothetical protein